MRWIIKRLNLKNITGEEAIHEALAKKLNFPEYYGANWDALYDLLTEIGRPTKIILSLPAKESPELSVMLRVFVDAEEANENLKVSCCKEEESESESQKDSEKDC